MHVSIVRKEGNKVESTHLVRNRKLLERLEYHIRPTSHVIGIKLLKGEDPEAMGLDHIPDPMSVCQFTTFMRTTARDTKPVYMLQKDICCAYAQHVFGMIVEKGLKSGLRDVQIHFGTEEGFRKAYDSLTILEEHSVTGMVAGPLYSFDLEPDLILFALMPGQINRFGDGYLWSKGGCLTVKFSGMCGICSNTIAKAYAEKDAVLGLPCFGGRRVGLYQDHEVAAAIHMDVLEDWLDGLDKTEATGHHFPIAFDLNRNTVGAPHYKIVHWPDVIIPAPSTALEEDT